MPYSMRELSIKVWKNGRLNSSPNSSIVKPIEKVLYWLINNRNRSKTTDTEIDATFRREIKASTYRLYTRSLTDKEQNSIQAGDSV